MKSFNAHLNVMPKGVINNNDYIRVLLTLTVPEAISERGQLKIKINNEPFTAVYYEHEPIVGSVYFADSHLDFGSLNYGKKYTKELKMCSECDQKLYYEVKFLTSKEELEDIKKSDRSVPNSGIVFTEFPSIHFNSSAYVESSSSKNTLDIIHDSYCPTAYKHFELQNWKGIMSPRTLTNVDIIFAPNLNEECDFDDTLEPPFFVKTYLLITISRDTELIEKRRVLVTAFIPGPDVELRTTEVNYDSIYMGEEHFHQFHFYNKEGRFRARVNFIGTEGLCQCTALMKPDNGILLDRQRGGYFCMTFFTQMIGKFSEILLFKVKNGHTLSAVVRGFSNQIRVLTTPQNPNLGTIPFAVPQIFDVFLRNPLYTPIVIKCYPNCDGTEKPLVLNVNDKNFLPIDVDDPIKKYFNINADIQAAYEEEIYLQNIHDNETQADSEIEQTDFECSEFESNEEVTDLNEIENENTDKVELSTIQIPSSEEEVDNNICTKKNKSCTFRKFYGIDEDRPYYENSIRTSITSQRTVADDDIYINDLNNENKINKENVSKSTEHNSEVNMPIEEEENELKSVKTNVSIATTKCSQMDEELPEEFEKVLDVLPELAVSLVWSSRNEVIKEQTFAEINIVKNTLDVLLNTEYFANITQFQDYKYMNWTAIPSNPREIYCNNEPIYLRPNEGKFITVIVIPNALGKRNCTINIQICPETRCDGKCTDCDYSYISSKLMKYQYPLFFECKLPVLTWDNEINLRDSIIYAEEMYYFCMSFTNEDNVDGFFYYYIIPDCEDGTMTLDNDHSKFFIEIYETINVDCIVKFKKIGNVSLWGSIKLVGSLNEYPFSINATVLPTRVRIIPNTVFRRQRVLCKTREYIFIENLTPTFTKLSLSLKNTHYQNLDVHGFKFCAIMQSMYITLESKFYDPGTYNNVIYLSITNGSFMEIPIQYVIEGMPICFYPDITKNADFGHLLINTKENFLDEHVMYNMPVVVKNLGFREYKLNITKIRGAIPKCDAESMKGNCNIEPKILLLAPGSEKLIQISTNAFEATTLYNEFRIQIVDQSFKQRVYNVRFVVKAQFTEPELNWSRKLVNFDYYRTHADLDREDIRGIELQNIANTDVHTVHLKTTGPFKIKEYYEDHFKKELTFPMKSLESKSIIILLNKALVQRISCAYQDGKILCTANGKLQKPLNLRASIYHPYIRIMTPNIVLFSKKERNMYIDIANVGCMYAQYKWKKLSETIKYVAQLENPAELAHQILSDILWMLELSDDYDSNETDSTCGHNLTCIYQKHRRCHPRKIEDTIGVSTIIDEIIDNLDLTAKRYKMHFEDYDEISIQDEPTAYKVKKTLYEIIDHLKLDDSVVTSEPSSIECLLERSIYFYEKSGTIEEGYKQCMLHLPSLRNGFEKKASFELQIVGGTSQFFNITLVRLEKTIELSKESIYLGIRPWYEKFKSKVKVRNVTQYDIILQIEEYPKRKISAIRRIPQGYMHITSRKRIVLTPFQSTNIKFVGVLGFCEHFRKFIKLTVNDSEIKYIHIKGQGIIPIFTSLKLNMPRIRMDTKDIIDEYKLLKEIYYYEEFKALTELDDEELGIGEEMESVSFQWSISDISTGSEYDSITNMQHERNFFSLLKTYVFVYANDVPDPIILQQILETRKFVYTLMQDTSIAYITNSVYREYIKFLNAINKPVHLKYFTIQPLPFDFHGYILNMGELKLNRFHRFDIVLRFFGPGKITAAARTAVKIPGLYVTFCISNRSFQGMPNYDYVYYVTEDKMPQCFLKRYRNQYEREIDLETNPKLKHAHSYDVDLNLKHKRNILAKDRKCIRNFYSIYSLNKSVCIERKNHNILCKVLSNLKKNISGVNMCVRILIKPEEKFYEEGQLLEDLLFIDLHLGPTLPILLRGVMVKR